MNDRVVMFACFMSTLLIVYVALIWLLVATC